MSSRDAAYPTVAKMTMIEQSSAQESISSQQSLDTWKAPAFLAGANYAVMRCQGSCQSMLQLIMVGRGLPAERAMPR